MALIRITAPATEPVSRTEMKSHLRLDYDDEDTLVDQYISAARQKLEQRCARSFVAQTWELRASAFEASIEIPKPPTSAITQVTYLDEDHVEQTVDDALYALVQGGEYEASSLIWLDADDIPDELAERPDAARIRFTAGWETNEFPYAIKMAIMLTAASMYELRQDVLMPPSRQELMPLPDGAATYIAPYIIPRL